MSDIDDWGDDPFGGDINFDSDFDNPGGKKGFVRSFATGFLKGIKDNTYGNSDAQLKTLRTVLPDSFRDTFNNISTLNRKRKELADEFKQHNGQAVQDLQYITDRTLSKFKDKLPNKITEMGMNFSNKDFSGWGKSSSSSDSGPTMEGTSDEDVSNLESSTYDAVTQQSSVLASMGEALANVATSVGGATVGAIQTGNNQLSGINDSLRQLVDYQRKVQARNDAIKINLLARMHMTNAKFYKFMEAGTHRSINELKLIAKYSEMSDFQKTSNSQFLKKNMRDKFFGSVSKKIGGVAGLLGDKFGKDARQGAYGAFGGAFGGLRMGMEMSEGMPLNYGEMAGGIVAQQLIANLPRYMQEGKGAQYVAKMKGQFPKQSKIITDIWKTMSKVGRITSYASNNAKGILNNQIGEYDLEDAGTYEDYLASLPSGTKPMGKAQWWAMTKGKGLANKGLNALLENSTKSKGTTTLLTNKSLKDLSAPAVWTEMSARTLNEVIPGWLSKLHLSLEKLRTGNDSLKAETYNFGKGKFLSSKTNAKAVKESLFKNKEFGSYASSAMGIVDKIDKDGTLSQSARKALALRIAKDSDKDAFDPYAYAEFSGEGLDPRISKEIQGVVRSSFGITDEHIAKTKKGSTLDRLKAKSTVGDEKGQELALSLSNRVESLKRWMPSIAENLDLLRFSGQDEQLRKLGLVFTENGQDHFNMDGFWDEIGKHIEGQVTDEAFNKRKNDKDDFARRIEAEKAKRKSSKLGRFKHETDEQIADRLREEDKKEAEKRKLIASGKGSGYSEEDSVPTRSDLHLGGGAGASNIDLDRFESIFAKMEGKFDELGTNIGKMTSSISGDSGIKELTPKVDETNTTLNKILETAQQQLAKINDILSSQPSKKSKLTETEESVADKAKSGILNRLKGLGPMKDIFNGGVEKLLAAQPLMLGGLLGGLAGIAVHDPKMALLLGAGGALGAAYMKLRSASKSETPSDDEDIYVEGEPDPVLQSRKLKNGDYYDRVKKAIIKSWTEISGTIVDVTTNLAITAQTLGQKLFGADGRAVMLSGLDKAKSLAIKLFKWIDPLSRFEKLKDKVANKFYSQDIYVPGNDVPVLQGNKFGKGYYFKRVQGTFVELKGWNEIDGPVYDSEGNVLLTQEDFESGLITSTGFKIDKFKKFSGSMGKLGLNLLGKAKDKLVSGAKKTGEGVKDLVKSDYSPIVNSVDRIYALLCKHWHYEPDFGKDISATIMNGGIKPGSDEDEKLRANSQQDKELKAKEAKKEAAEDALVSLAGALPGRDKNKGDKDKKKGGLFGGLLSGIGGFLMNPMKYLTTMAGGLLGGGMKLLGSFLSIGVKTLPLIASGIMGLGKALIGLLGGGSSGVEDFIDDVVGGEEEHGKGKGKGRTRRRRTTRSRTRTRAGGRGRGGLIGRGVKGLFGQTFKQAGRSGRWAGSAMRGLGKGAKFLGGLGAGKVGRIAGGLGKGLGGAAAGLGIDYLRTSGMVDEGSVTDDALGMAQTGMNVVGALGGIEALGAGASMLGMSSVGGALAGAAGGLASILFSPVVLVGAVLGGGAYLAYKYYTKGKGKQLDLRMAQYGIADASSDFAAKVLSIENVLKDYVVTTNGTAKISEKAPLEQIFAPLTNGLADEKAKQSIYGWFNYRFKPVFLMTHSSLSIGKYKTIEEYDNATDGKVYTVAKAVHDSLGNVKPYPYDVTYQIDKDTHIMNKAETLKIVNECFDQLKTYNERHGKTADGISKEAVKSVQTSDMAKKQLAQSEKEGNWFSDDKGNLGIWDRWRKKGEIEDTEAMEAKLPKPIDIRDLIPDGKPLDVITVFRLAAYGNDSDKPWMCEAVLKLERYCEHYFTVSKDKVDFQLKAEDVYNAFKGSFRAEHNSNQWLMWFNYRFIPVMKVWVGECFKIRNGEPVKVWKSLSDTNLFDIANVMVDLKVMVNKNLISIWDINEAPFPYSYSARMTSDVKEVLSSLEVKATQAKLKNPKLEQDKSKPNTIMDVQKQQKDKDTLDKLKNAKNDPTQTAMPGISKANSFANADTGPNVGLAAGSSYGSGNTAFDQYVKSTIKEPPPLKNVNQKQAEKALYDVAVKHGLQGTELAMFMAQCAEESGNFSTFTEGVNYSVDNMMRIWPNRFPTRAAAEALHSQGKEAVINAIYGRRNGNRPGTSDGWDYRGRGYIQLTGRDNYALAARMIGDTSIIQHPELVSSDLSKGAEASLGWWLGNKRVRSTAQQGDIKGNTKAVNGGYTNYEKRLSYYQKYLGLVQSGNLAKQMATQQGPDAANAGMPDATTDAGATSTGDSSATNTAAQTSGYSSNVSLAAPGGSNAPATPTPPSPPGGGNPVDAAMMSKGAAPVTAPSLGSAGGGSGTAGSSTPSPSPVAPSTPTAPAPTKPAVVPAPSPAAPAAPSQPVTATLDPAHKQSVDAQTTLLSGILDELRKQGQRPPTMVAMK